MKSPYFSPCNPQDAAHHHMLTARALHANAARVGNARFDVLDWSSLVAGTRVAAGLDGFDSSKVRLPMLRESRMHWLTLLYTALEQGHSREG